MGPGLITQLSQGPALCQSPLCHSIPSFCLYVPPHLPPAIPSYFTFLRPSSSSLLSVLRRVEVCSIARLFALSFSPVSSHILYVSAPVTVLSAHRPICFLSCFSRAAKLCWRESRCACWHRTQLNPAPAWLFQPMSPLSPSVNPPAPP